MRRELVPIAALLLVAAPAVAVAAPGYAWQFAPGEQTFAERIPPPPGFSRTSVAADSWAAWLRGLPMKPANAPVLIYTGAQKWRQDVHAAVIDIDVGKRNLQQCADAIMRLRAEWLFAADRKGDIRFNDTEGKRLTFSSRRDSGYAAFRKYMDYVFAYAGTYSLERELKPAPLASLQTGDVFIKGGFPATPSRRRHGRERTDGREALPARAELHARTGNARPQEPGRRRRFAWYPAAFDGELVTPEWTFADGSLAPLALRSARSVAAITIDRGRRQRTCRTRPTPSPTSSGRRASSFR